MAQSDIHKLLFGRIGIIGFGVEGRSTLSFLHKNGFGEITIFDKNPVDISDKGVTVVTGDTYLDQLHTCDVIIRSAGVNPTLPEIEAFTAGGGFLTSQVDLFFELWPGEIIGVTGTLGKGTCVSMIQDVFEYAGVEYVLGGNIGTAVLDLLEGASGSTYALLELSSFQLMALKRSPRYAIILKTTSEHLDWHKDRDEYIEAKANLVRHQQESDCCIYNADVEGSCRIAQKSIAAKRSFGTSGKECSIEGELITIGENTLHLKECSIKGVHNLENKAAAFLLAAELGIPFEKCREALVQFKGLKYRLQKSGVSKDGIVFYNDSYATRPDATIGAIKSFRGPLMLILGGSEKHADFSELAQAVKDSQNIKYIALIGATADRLETVLLDYNIDIKIEKLNSLEEAVAQSVKKSNIYSNDEYKEVVVLLSPACASFGMFKNYVHRGDVFNEIIAEYA